MANAGPPGAAIRSEPASASWDQRWEAPIDGTAVWRDGYRAVDENGQILDVFVSRRRDSAAAEWSFAKVLRDRGEPVEVVTDKSPVLGLEIDNQFRLEAAFDELLPTVHR